MRIPKEAKGEKRSQSGNQSQVERRRLIAKVSLPARLRVGRLAVLQRKTPTWRTRLPA